MHEAVFAFILFSSVPTVAVAAYTVFVYGNMVDELRVFARFVFLSVFIELTSKTYWFLSMNNMPLLHLYVATGFVCIALFYEKVLKGFIKASILRTILFSFLTFTIINSIFIQDIFTFNSYALTVESVLIIILSLTTYMVLMDDIVKKSRAGLIKSLNWINSGLFLYYSSSILIFYFGELITSFFPSPLLSLTWVIHALFSNIMYGCFFVGLWYRPANR